MKIVWDALTRKEWERLGDRTLAPLQQRWVYGEVSRALNAHVHRAIIEDTGTPVAMAQILFRRVVVTASLASRGPIWLGALDADRQTDAFSVLSDALRKKGAHLKVWSPETSCSLGEARLLQVMTPATLAELTLDRDNRSRLHGKWRNRLVRAERAGLSVATGAGDAATLLWLFARDRETQRMRGFRALPHAFVSNWPSDCRHLIVATIHGDIAAAALFLRHGNTATYHIGWSGESGRRLSAQNLLLWRAIEELRSKGVARLDLGTIDTERAPGLARFKLGTGAIPRVLGGTWIG